MRIKTEKPERNFTGMIRIKAIFFYFIPVCPLHPCQFLFSLVLSFVLLFQSFAPAFACGPGYVSPVFDYKHAPENPFENFAAGRLGIVKTSYHRVVLFAAYRYLNGGSFSADEQKALVEVWKSEFDNKSFADDDEAVKTAVKAWVEKRKEVAKDEETLPPIYTEREYGGYDFFPNCTASAFETATQTLSDRITSHGAEDKNVRDWLKAQDAVFNNCASGEKIPAPAAPEAPEWLKKDREYQIAAANFYSLNYAAARDIWTRIAEDSDSVWAETADYLIARTLVREASLSKDEARAKEIYLKAEEHLNRLTLRGGKFYNASLKLLNLIKYRVHPEDRARELARTLASPGASGDNFRQDLIDYTWLLDKFEKQVLEAEEKRKAELKKQEEEEVAANANANVNASVNSANSAMTNANTTVYAASNAANYAANANYYNYNYEQVQSGEALSFYLSLGENQGRSFTFPVAKTDEEIFAEVETQIGRPLNDADKEKVREARRQSYRNKTANRSYNDYQGGYFGAEETSLEILPEFLRAEDLTDWLFAYQIEDDEAYRYALARWRENKSDLWLMTALSRADANSADLKSLLEEAERISPYAPAFATVAYHAARIFIAQGKAAEARKLLDEILNSTLDLPVSSRNLFLEQRMTLAETLDEFLKYAQRKPFAFDFDGSTGTIEEFIAEQKSWYDPKYYKDQTREEYEREVEERFREEKLWQDRLMFDADAVEIISRHFPLAVLVEAEKSPALPDYLRKQLATAIWTRAVLLDNEPVARKIGPEFVRLAPEFAELFAHYQKAPTPLERKRAALFLILKNPILSPYIESGIGKTDNETTNFDADDWWCEPYDYEYSSDGEQKPKTPPKRPAFLTKAQSDGAQAERQKLKEIGDAPKFFGETVLAWQKAAPLDKRVPESLYIAFQANGWTKYGCGNNIELRAKIGNVLKSRYPRSEWTTKVFEEEQGN